MINGVDVSGCIFLDEWKHCNCCNDLIKTIYPNATKCHVEQDLRCETYPNCYFKQLARKTQECEELKEELDKEHLLMLEKQDKATRYFLVLNGIKEYIYNNTDFDVNDSIQSKTSGYDILQIIKDV